MPTLDDLLLDSFNENFTKIVEDTKNLRIAFIRTRFNYLRQYCEKVTGEKYTHVTLAGMANVLTGFQVEAPGTELDPWADFAGRHESLKESDYLDALFNEPRSGLTPKEMFVHHFNAYLATQRVPVKLKNNGFQLDWVLV